MRILVLTANPNLGSTARTLQSWLVRGRSRGVQGYLVLGEAGPLLEWARQQGLPHINVPMPLPSRRWPIPSLESAWRIAAWARQNGVQSILCNEHDIYPFATLLRTVLRIPLMCYVHFLVGREYSRWVFRGPRRRPDAVFWTTQWQMDQCRDAVSDLVPERCQHLVPSGLDLSEYGTLASTRATTRANWGATDGTIVIGTASAMKPVKRLEDFIQVVASIAREDSRVMGVIAGDAPRGAEAYRTALLDQIRATGLGDRLRWVGHMEPLEPFHHACDIFVSTSECETFGMSVCEAMACGRPVVAYEGGSVQEVVGPAGRVVATYDEGALREAISRLVNDESERMRLGHAARERVASHFQPFVSLEQLITVQHDLMMAV